MNRPALFLSAQSPRHSSQTTWTRSAAPTPTRPAPSESWAWRCVIRLGIIPARILLLRMRTTRRAGGASGLERSALCSACVYIHTNICVCIYIYMYIDIDICVCVCTLTRRAPSERWELRCVIRLGLIIIPARRAKFY